MTPGYVLILHWIWIFSNSLTLIIWYSAEADPSEQGSATIAKEGDKFYLRGPGMDEEELGRFSANYL